MKQAIPDPILARLSDFVAQAVGLHFPPTRWSDLQRGVSAAAADLGFKDPADCALEMIAHPADRRQLDALADHLTVGETYFFREPATFEALAGRVLPDLIRRRQSGTRQLRIWSAACCTGEEPYSIAMAVHEAIGDLAEWDITILATDISPRFLRKARKGVFGPWSFRGAPARLKDRYFLPAGNELFAVAPHIRRMVTFAQLNLVDDTYPTMVNNTHAMDVIFCRNVLMYFTPEQAAKVMEKLDRAQPPSGWLLVSASELSSVPATHYEPVKYPSAIIYRKHDPQTQQGDPNSPRGEEVLSVSDAQFPFMAGGGSPGLRLGEMGTPAAAATAASATNYHKSEPAPEIAVTPLPGGAASASLAASDAPAAAISAPTAVALSPDLSAIEREARSLADQGKLAEAVACCDRWISHDALAVSARYLRAVVLQELGDIEQAVASLRAAVYLDPAFVLAHFALGAIAQRRGKRRDADRHFRTALRLSARYREDQELPESDGITAGRFAQMVHGLQAREAVA